MGPGLVERRVGTGSVEARTGRISRAPRSERRRPHWRSCVGDLGNTFPSPAIRAVPVRAVAGARLSPLSSAASDGADVVPRSGYRLAQAFPSTGPSRVYPQGLVPPGHSRVPKRSYIEFHRLASRLDPQRHGFAVCDGSGVPPWLKCWGHGASCSRVHVHELWRRAFLVDDVVSRSLRLGSVPAADGSTGSAAEYRTGSRREGLLQFIPKPLLAGSGDALVATLDSGAH